MPKRVGKRVPVVGAKVWRPPPGGVLDLRNVKPATPASPGERKRVARIAAWLVTADGKCGECGEPMGEHSHGIRCSWWDVHPDATPF